MQDTRRHVTRYCSAHDEDAEFQSEWQRLADYLAHHGGLDELLRQTFASDSAISLRPRGSVLMQAVLGTLSDEIRGPNRVSTS